jgi:hypothetical protein
MNLLKVDVTQDDINNGTQRNCIQCPVARAAKRAFDQKFNKLHHIIAGTHIIAKIGHEYIFNVKTPDEVILFMGLFDFGNIVKPFSFEINLEDNLAGSVI